MAAGEALLKNEPPELQTGDPSADGPELVFAVVRPVGTPDQAFHQALAGALLAYGYTTLHIKLSTILADHAEDRGQPIAEADEINRINSHMNEGNLVCEQYKHPAAVALLGVNEIWKFRVSKNGSGKDGGAEIAVDRTAYVLDSIKRPAEVTHLRRIYGERFLLFGVQAALTARQDYLFEKVAPQLGTTTDLDDLKTQIDALIERDHTESTKMGQNTLQTFPLADVFVDVEHDVNDQVVRVIDLLFGSPTYHEPTPDEYGMQLAYISSTRSPELGLKVGAAILTTAEGVVGLGVNTHPLALGTPKYDASQVDIGDLVIDMLQHLSGSSLSDIAVQRLAEEPEKLSRELLEGPLHGAKIRHLTEFQRTVHAEMSALLEAIRKGTSITGSTLYVTAYPCHNCAKHILALGIKVKYLEPYLSLATETGTSRARFRAPPSIGPVGSWPSSLDRLAMFREPPGSGGTDCGSPDVPRQLYQIPRWSINRLAIDLFPRTDDQFACQTRIQSCSTSGGGARRTVRRWC